jgi:hypothetical protein
VCALGDSRDDVLRLVRTALQLADEEIQIARELPEAEALALGLKPFQVKHL